MHTIMRAVDSGTFVGGSNDIALTHMVHSGWENAYTAAVARRTDPFMLVIINTPSPQLACHTESGQGQHSPDGTCQKRSCAHRLCKWPFEVQIHSLVDGALGQHMG